MSETSLKQLIDALAHAPDPEREAAAQALAAWGDRALVSLRPLLAAGPDARWWVARALAAVGTRQALTELLPLLRDADPDVRACAAHGLGILLPQVQSEPAAQPAVDRLVRLLDDDSPYVARIAGNALIQIREPAVPALIQALSHPSPAVRAGAARALTPLKSDDAIPALYAALDDDSALVSHYANEALDKLGLGIVLLL